jgi:endonuclease YncB( thermonuclease family)
MSGALAVLIATLGFSVVETVRAAPDQQCSRGVTSVTDGDTIRVALESGPIVVRLSGIDAPERRQAWGAEAQQALTRRVNGEEVMLEVVSQDRFDRLVAVVYREDAVDEWNVNAWLIREGHAWVYRQFARDEAMCRSEDEARGDGRGLWKRRADRPVAPWEWRRLQAGQLRTVTDFRDETATNCIRAVRDARRRADARALAATVGGGAGSSTSAEQVVAETACVTEAGRQGPRLMSQAPAQPIAGGYRVALSTRTSDGGVRAVECRFWTNTGRAQLGR